MPRIDNVASQEGLEEAEAFCRLMVTNTIGELLEPSKRAQMPPNFNYRRLIVILAKYRCCDPCPARQGYLRADVVLQAS